MKTGRLNRKTQVAKLGRLHKFGLTLLSGLLLALAFNISNLWLLGLIALVPFLFVLKNTSSLREAVLHGFSIGLVYFGSVLLFFFSAYPLNWAGIESKALSAVGITTVWLLSTSVLSLGPTLWSAVIHQLKNSSLIFLFAPVAWVLTEFFQATFFSVFFAGGGGLIGPHWTFGFLGYIVSENIFLLSLAALGGVFILSFVVVLINLLIHNFINNGRLSTGEVAGVAAVIIFSGLFFFQTPTSTGEREVAAFHTNFEPGFIQDQNKQQEQFSETDKIFRDIAFGDEHFDIIVLPENSFYFSQLPKIGQKYRLDSLTNGGEVLIIDSVRTREVGPDHSLVSFINSNDEQVTFRPKRLLVPQGEYLSYGYAWIGKTFLGKEWYEQFTDRRSLIRGEEVVIGYSGGIGVGSLFCSEVMTPNIYRDTVRAGAEILTNSASHAVFTNSENLASQILKYSKLRAVENGRYYVQAGNGVPSFVLTNRGELVGKVSGKNSVLKATVLTFNNSTPFNIVGSTGIFLISLLTMTALLYIERLKSNPQSRV